MIKILLIFLAFAFIHSITVAGWFKDLSRSLLGDTFMRVWYRFFYTLISILTVAAAFLFIADVPDKALWHAPSWLRWYLHAVQLGALVFGAAAFRHLDGLEFLGFRQVWRYLSGRVVTGDREGLRANGLVTSGVYGIVRHPLYLAGIIFFTFHPNITTNGLAVTVLADLYFIFGAVLEERRFIGAFGDEYREYMKRVPRLFPRLA